MGWFLGGSVGSMIGLVVGAGFGMMLEQVNQDSGMHFVRGELLKHSVIYTEIVFVGFGLWMGARRLA